jgi:hypothetical protein
VVYSSSARIASVIWHVTCLWHLSACILIIESRGRPTAFRSATVICVTVLRARPTFYLASRAHRSSIKADKTSFRDCYSPSPRCLVSSEYFSAARLNVLCRHRITRRRHDSDCQHASFTVSPPTSAASTSQVCTRYDTRRYPANAMVATPAD